MKLASTASGISCSKGWWFYTGAWHCGAQLAEMMGKKCMHSYSSERCIDLGLPLFIRGGEPHCSPDVV